jgi:hypothetical protein
MGLFESIEQTAFLGEEYLTWLWFRGETDPEIDLGKLGKIAVELGETLVLRGEEDQDTVQVTLKGDRAGASAEARAALREGKRLFKCKFRFKQGDLVWPCSLTADSLGFSGLGLPVPRGVPMPDNLIMRAEKLEEFAQYYFQIFEVFLGQRLRADAWSSLEASMLEWVVGGEA